MPYYTKEDVAKLVKDLGADDVGVPEGVEIGAPTMFGLELLAYDPVSGQVITICRPHRVDVGEPGILLKPKEFADAVVAARQARVGYNRAHGIVAPLTAEQKAAAEKARAAERKAAEQSHAAAAAAASQQTQAQGQHPTARK